MLVSSESPCVNGPVSAEEAAAKTAAEAATMEATSERSYLFRGDDNYQGGPVGRARGAEADGAQIQNIADHVLRKESGITSRYASFSEEVKIARKFTSAAGNRHVRKVELAVLRDLEAAGIIKIWNPDQAYTALKAGPRKLSRQAADVRAAMRKNSEILIEGQIPAAALERVN
jgi:hypothetical protein